MISNLSRLGWTLPSKKKKNIKSRRHIKPTENFHVILCIASFSGIYFFCMVINFNLNHLLCTHIHKYTLFCAFIRKMASLFVLKCKPIECNFCLCAFSSHFFYWFLLHLCLNFFSNCVYTNLNLHCIAIKINTP